jgi:rare lipoprotein A (peptidoglycan hydrolase)
MRNFWFFTLTVLLLFFQAAAQDKKPDQFIGRASYYADKFHGRRTASGERFDMNAFTAAHRSLPFGTRVKVTNLRNQKSVVLRINERGPYIHFRYWINKKQTPQVLH